MFEAAPVTVNFKTAQYAELTRQARALPESQRDRIANAANRFACPGL